MQLALLSLLLVVIALLVMRAVTRERREYGRFKRLRTTAARQKVFARWLRESFLMFGGLTAAVLLAAHPYVPSVLDDARSWAPARFALDFLETDAGRGIVLGLALALVLGLVLPIFLLRNHTEEIPTIGDVAALLPRTRGEVKYGLALGTNAGLVEELLFRLALPALVFGIIGDGALAFLITSVLFGLLHLYQGPVGVISSTVLGLVFSVVYVLSGSIVLAIVLHVLFDLRSLVLIPVVVMKVWRKVA